jgi:hypothetical protein
MSFLYIYISWSICLLLFIRNYIKIFSLKKRYGISLDKIGSIKQLKASLEYLKDERLIKEIWYISITHKLSFVFFILPIIVFIIQVSLPHH